jgi:hypothetical protein
MVADGINFGVSLLVILCLVLLWLIWLRVGYNTDLIEEIRDKQQHHHGRIQELEKAE